MQILKEGVFTDMLGFDDIPALPGDFELSNFYTNCYPESGFRRFIMINLFTETGRYSMFNQQLTINGTEVVQSTLKNEEIPEALLKYFGIDTVSIQMT